MTEAKYVTYGVAIKHGDRLPVSKQKQHWNNETNKKKEKDCIDIQMRCTYIWTASHSYF